MDSSKRRFNIIDVILLLIILLVVVAIAGKIAFPDFFRTKGEELVLSCTLVTDSKISPYASALSEGDKLYVNDKLYFGTVAEVKREYLGGETAEGAEAEVPEESYIRYELTVISEATKKDGAYRLEDGTVIVRGLDITLNSRDTVAFFKITDTVISEPEN